MEGTDADRQSTVFRLCRRFPPHFPDDYITVGMRRSFASQPELVQVAATGLSVYSTLGMVIANARRFPRLGTIVVRYSIPIDSPLRVFHLVGPPEHLTVLGNFFDLHSCLDRDWRFDVDIMER